MKLQRFYVAGRNLSQISKGEDFGVADDGLVNQLKNVFRFHVGDIIAVFDGDGQDHECFIQSFEKGKVWLKEARVYESRFMPAREIWLCAAVVKKDNFEWIAEKATELGVSHIVPIVSERSEKKSLNMERLQKIVVEASEQSGRGNVPTIHSVIELEKGIEYVKSQVASDQLQMVVFHTEGELLQDGALDAGKSVAVFIGPEGGWSEKEVELFHTENIPMKSLGKQVLRAETAAVAILAKLILV